MCGEADSTCRTVVATLFAAEVLEGRQAMPCAYNFDEEEAVPFTISVIGNGKNYIFTCARL